MKRIIAKEQVCIGCRLCEIYCAVAHSKSKDIIKAMTRENPKPLPRVVVHESEAISFAIQCRVCDEPMCVQSCISGAMHRDPDGVVRVDEEKCIGCWTCVISCPYGAITRGIGEQAVAVKCDMCPGLDIPACVANCPNEALVCEEAEASEKV
jgi:carbon-monoxide dehydrogenase iron sulfur subunit